ncbi:MAG: hypothetical protein B7Y80_00985 [Hyphomicrobium sp. 32-62-53]|nr:MAG: hypothetical protein B7Z29_14305 [Hyphomicrobium sp. 12-62-95]OYY01916.1 MAG: hypothetical protein B7Y80_00985 [Hyphomicrobium sp. 32-62-53]
MAGAQPGDAAELGSTNGAGKAPPKATVREIRLSFWYFFVVIKWGSERRSSDRIADDRQVHPTLTASTLPVLATMWAALFLILYLLLQLFVRFVVYLVS